MKKTQMEKFKSDMLGFIKYQQEQQLSLQKQQMENQENVLKLRGKNLSWINLPRLGHKNTRKCFFVSIKNRKKLFGIFNRSQNVAKENAIWKAIDTFTNAAEDRITFASYFRRYEDLYKT